MLEAFEILTTSGVVLWSKSYAPVGAHVINSLINDVFIEEKVVPQSSSGSGTSPVFKKEKYTLKWKRVKEFNLIFVVRSAARRMTKLVHVAILTIVFTGCLSITAAPWMDRQALREHYDNFHRSLQGPTERKSGENYCVSIRSLL